MSNYTLDNWIGDILDSVAPSMESAEYHHLLPAIIIAAALDNASQRIADAIESKSHIYVEQA